MLVVNGLTKSYGESPIFSGLTFALDLKDIWAFCGASGSGKSTLLRCICGLETYDSGTITLEGKPLQKESVGLVLQTYDLFPHYDALSNVVLPLILVKGFSKRKAEDTANKMIEKVGMNEFFSSHVQNLSGGQRQRIAIARALALKPSLLLLDEPSSALDSNNKEKLAALLKELKEEGSAIIVATHDQVFLKELGATLMHLHAKQDSSELNRS